MGWPLEVVVVMAKCNNYKNSFGIRLEKQEGKWMSKDKWIADWAFAIKENQAKREGYDKQNISGAFGFADEYPCCPHCENPGLYKCGCGNVACWDGRAEKVTCPWCGANLELEGEINNLDVGGDV